MRVWQSLDYMDGVHPRFDRAKAELEGGKSFKVFDPATAQWRPTRSAPAR